MSKILIPEVISKTFTDAFPWRIPAVFNRTIHLKFTAVGGFLKSNFFGQNVSSFLKNIRNAKNYSIGCTPFPMEVVPGIAQMGKEARNKPGFGGGRGGMEPPMGVEPGSLPVSGITRDARRGHGDRLRAEYGYPESW